MLLCSDSVSLNLLSSSLRRRECALAARARSGWRPRWLAVFAVASLAAAVATVGLGYALPALAQDTVAKISLSHDEGSRGKEITISGTGFNSGTTAEAFVLVAGYKPAQCKDLIDDNDAQSLGTATVDSGDEFSISLVVHGDKFDPGKVNWICAKDSEPSNNRNFSDVDGFELTPSMSVSPGEVNFGGEVTVQAWDFAAGDATISLSGNKSAIYSEITDSSTGDFVVTKDGSDAYLFDMPGGLSGTVNISLARGGAIRLSTIGVLQSVLNLSKNVVAPNDSIVITGEGFSEKSYILVSEITLDGEPIVVDESGVEEVTTAESNAAGMPGDAGKYAVKTASGGVFIATIKAWAADGARDNPALDDGTYEFKVRDAMGFIGSASLTVLAPTVTVHPAVASPRDYIEIRGANWPVSNSDDDREVMIAVDGRNRSATIDNAGRFFYHYRLHPSIRIGKEHTITVTYDDDGPGDIQEEATIAVPSSGVTITPAAASPGDTITLELTGMPSIELVEEVLIDGRNRVHAAAHITDLSGNVTVEVLVPYSDPGYYPVRITIAEEVVNVQLEILAESTAAGAAAALPGVLTDLGDNLVAVFYFNSRTKEWSFYDPRGEFAELNTLSELTVGQPYWILVSRNQDDLVLNGLTRSFSCVAGDCWNYIVW